MNKEKVNQRSQQKQNTRLKLMNAAMALFVEQGYEQVTLVEIAERADIHVQTLYKHFKTKASLATSYFDWYLDMAIHSLDQLQAGQSVFEEVSKATLTILNALMTTKDALPMFQMIHKHEELLASTQHRLRLFEDHLAFILQKQGSPQLDELEAKMLATMMVGAYRDAHFSWIRSSGRVSSASKYEGYLRLIKLRFF